MRIVFPNYEESLLNLTCSIAKYFEIEYHHSTLKEIDDLLEEKKYQNVVVLLYDGLGSNILQRMLPADSFLVQHKKRDLVAVFPATTTAVTVTMMSGLAPIEHGWLGWDLYFKAINRTVSLFPNTIKDSDVKAADTSVAQKYLPYQSILSKINEKGQYQAHEFFPFGPNQYDSLDDLNLRIKKLCQTAGKKYLYGYYNNPDTLMHLTGTNSAETIKNIELLNLKTEELCSDLKDTLVIVVADHGHLNSSYATLSDYPELFKTIKQETAIEPRACAFYIKEGMEETFALEFNRLFQKDFLLLTKEEVINQKLFGEGIENPLFNESLGDYLAIATSNLYFRYSNKSHIFKSMHAGLTEDEMIIPLIVIDKK